MPKRAGTRASISLVATLLLAPATAATVVLDARFATGPDGFSYVDDAFAGTSEPDYASGSWLASDGWVDGGLQVGLGGLDGSTVTGMSGGWRTTFALDSPQELELTLRYRLTTSADQDGDEYGLVMVSLDGAELGTIGNPWVSAVFGNGDGGVDRGTGWRRFRIHLGTLPAGAHTLTTGGYCNKKNDESESTQVLIDDVRLATPGPVTDPSVQLLVDALDPARFRQNIVTLAGFGTRFWAQQGNVDAGDWIEAELASYGYLVERHGYTFEGQPRENIHATKVGSVRPDQMLIVSAHMDSINLASGDGSVAPGADDDASGTSLVLEVARVVAPAEVRTASSLRFVLWNNEETGVDGSSAYVADRLALQGIEDPPGSGAFPEPRWLGIYQHDMILFDHGLPAQPEQIPGADVDVEYRAASSFGGNAIQLAEAALAANAAYAPDYPAEIGSEMDFTDSVAFEAHCPAVSLRENRRVAEIAEGSNPHWHAASDVVASYSDADFLFGFNTVRTTLAAAATLVEATVEICGDGIVTPLQPCDDGGTEPGDGCDGACQVEPGWTCEGAPSSCAICRPDDLGFPDATDPDRIAWSPPEPAICGGEFDVARGSLATLVLTGGFFGAQCLADNLAATEIEDAATPSPGSGFWYLVRVTGDSWDPVTGAVAATRDPALMACP